MNYLIIIALLIVWATYRKERAFESALIDAYFEAYTNTVDKLTRECLEYRELDKKNIVLRVENKKLKRTIGSLKGQITKLKKQSKK